MNVPLRNLDGDEIDEIELPEVFETPFRPDLIRQAVNVAQANASQPDGTDPLAGMRTSAESFGAGRGIAMVPRSNNTGRRVPQTVGGRTAHPPKRETDRSKSMNDQERQLAVRSALAATADSEQVRSRGHRLPEDVACPIVVSDDFLELRRTKQVVETLKALGVHGDIDRANDNRNRRAGRGTTRGRGRTEPKSILFITPEESGPHRGARNLAGADVATSKTVNATDLAPGGHAGRLTIFTESSLMEVANR